MSAFMVNNNVMSKVVTAILLNLDAFDGEGTCRVALLASPTDAQKEAGTISGVIDVSDHVLGKAAVSEVPGHRFDLRGMGTRPSGR